MRDRGDGLLVWVGSSSSRGGTPPYLAPYFAAKAAMDALAVSYALELSRFGIETSIIVPGSFTHGTNHFAHSGRPADQGVAAAYESRYAGLMDQVGQKLAEIEPTWADPTEVARAIVTVVGTEKGRRPYRVHIDPSDDGAAVVFAVGDRIRADFLRRIGLDDLLHPAA
jgi:NAD(P)-dependent dehydrogenase (short-subunit alcohol dehydrogenase family)